MPFGKALANVGDTAAHLAFGLLSFEQAGRSKSQPRLFRDMRDKASRSFE